MSMKHNSTTFEQETHWWWPGIGVVWSKSAVIRQFIAHWMAVDQAIYIETKVPPPPPPKCQNLTKTTPNVALTRGNVSKGLSRTWFKELRKQHQLFL